MSRPAPGVRADYVSFLPLTTRWMDNDALGHLNNVVYYSLMDTAVCHGFVARGILTWKGGAHLLMMVESGCRYHGEVAFPDAVMVGLRIAQVGARSIRHEAGVFAGGSETASAEGFMVHVCVDAVTRRPVAWPDVWRRSLEQAGG